MFANNLNDLKQSELNHCIKTSYQCHPFVYPLASEKQLIN